ncbi:hypothetical protein Tco_0663582 [Tanacetum coccineum]
MIWRRYLCSCSSITYQIPARLKNYSIRASNMGTSWILSFQIKDLIGKRFGFVKFINVFNEERLVDNLGTVWIGRYRIHANLAKFRRPTVGEARKCGYGVWGQNQIEGHVEVEVGTNHSNQYVQNHLLGLLLMRLKYHTRRYMWVMLELGSVSTQQSLLLHTGVNSWFQILQPAVHDFVSEERVVWVDIEGVLLNVWVSGDVCEIDIFLEKFKVVFRVKVFMARAKELFAWTPTFVEYKESEYISDDEGLQNSVHQPVGSEPVKEDLFDSDEEGVSDTIFEDNIVSPIKSVCHSSGKEGEHISEDPFEIYEMLNRNPTHVAKELDPSLSHPPGFTPVESQQEETNGGDKELPNSADPNVLNNFEVPANESCNGKSDDISSPNFANGGSFLDVLDGLVRVGQSMGYEMDGCLKDLENIIGNHGDSGFPK